MTHQRNISGLLNTATKKSENAFNNVTKVLDELEKQQKSASISSIAKAAKVSKAWIYRQKDIFNRIEELRLKHYVKVQDSPLKTKSNLLLVDSLRKRNKKLETENKVLRKQLEIFYGKLHMENHD